MSQSFCVLFLGFFICLGSATACSAGEGVKHSSDAVAPGAAIRDCEECPEMVPVTVQIDGEAVHLKVARYELTWKEYMHAYDQANCAAPANFDNAPIDLKSDKIRDDYPMTSIPTSKIDCYLDWIREKTGKPYRLPTESEWVAVAHLASGRNSLKAKDVEEDSAYLLGRLHDNPVYDDPRRPVERRSLARVGQFKPDGLGLYDMFGNAQEAVSDIAIFRDADMKSRKMFGMRQTIFKGSSIACCGSDGSEEFDVINGKKRFFSSYLSGTTGFRIFYEEKIRE